MQTREYIRQATRNDAKLFGAPVSIRLLCRFYEGYSVACQADVKSHSEAIRLYLKDINESNALPAVVPYGKPAINANRTHVS